MLANDWGYGQRDSSAVYRFLLADSSEVDQWLLRE